MGRVDVLERQSLWLWGLAAALLIGLALTVAILSLSQIENLQSVLLPRESFGTIMAAMVGMVVLFVLYGTWQHGRIRAKDAELERLATRELALRERLGELAAVLEMSGQLAQKLDARSTLQLAATRVLPCLEADCSSVYLFSPRTQRLEHVVRAGEPARDETIAATLGLDEGLVGLVYSTGEAQLVDSEERLSFLAEELGLPEVPSSALCVPIRFDKTRLGVFCIARMRSAGPFMAIHTRALQVLADHCGAAIVRRFHHARAA